MRHPDDPDVVPDTKAVAAFCLGVLGAVTGPALGGIVPASVALVLAAQARHDLVAGRGWRSGMPYAVWGWRLAVLGLCLAAVAAVLVAATYLLQGAGPVTRDFPSHVN